MTRDQLLVVIDEVAREGVVRASDLSARGVMSEDIQAARKRGDLTRVVQGIYVVGDEAPEGDQLARVALAYAGDGAVLTGLWAAALLGWKWIPLTNVIMVLVEPERRRRATVFWVKVRRCARLDRIPVRRVRGLPVADAAQIVVDACRQAKTLRDARGIVLGAVADKRCTVEEILAVMGEGQTAGTALCRRACVDAQRGATSPPEAEFCDALIGRGRPFYLNVEIWVKGRFVGKPDGYLVGTGTGWECDSREQHEAEDLLQATLDRDKRFHRGAGLSLEHETPTRFRRDPEAFVRRLFAEADRRADLGLLEPEGLELRPTGPLLS